MGTHTTPMREGVAQGSDRSAIVATLAAAGIVAPILFTVAFIAQGLLRPEYSHVAMPVSALATGPSGWVQNLNFFIFGFLMTAYAIGLHLGVRPSRAGLVGFAFLLLSGAGLVLAGVFPLEVDASGAIRAGQVLHPVAGFMSFLGAGFGLIAMSRGMTGDPRWRSLAAYALASGVAIVVVFLIIGASATRPDAPLYPWLGLVQRVALAVWFPCTIVLALRLLRVAKEPMRHVSQTPSAPKERP